MNAWLESRFLDRRFYAGAWTAIVLLYLLAATGNALTKAPWWDEGLFADPAYNLAFHGYMGASVQEPTGRPGGHMPLPGVDRYTFWNMPLYMVALAGWFKLFGFSILVMRSLSIVWGLLLVAAWTVIVKSFSDNRALPMLAGALIALDYSVLVSCSNGRPDCMTAALGAAGMAIYLRVREHNLSGALLGGMSLTAAAILTHPLGLIELAGVVFLVLYLDLRRLRWSHIPIVALPYAVAICAWGLYVLEAPDVFSSQFRASVGYRTHAFWNPIRSVVTDLTQRYFTFFVSAENHGLARLKGLILLAYVSGFLAALLIPAIRRQRIAKILLSISTLSFVALALLDGEKNPQYFVHVLPPFAILLATVVGWFWTKARIPHPLIGAAVFLLIALQLCGIAYKVKLDSYRNGYRPMIRSVTSYYKEGDVVMGGAELLFGLPRSIRFTDDGNLGFFSGKVPDLIIANSFYPSVTPGSPPASAMGRYLAALLPKYQQVYASGEFRVYVRWQPSDH